MLGAIAFNQRWAIERFVGLERVTVNVGSPLPPLRFSTLEGTATTVAPRAGRVLVLNVFTSWCPGCNVEMPDLVKLRNSPIGNSFDLIGIDEQEQPQIIRSFMDHFRATYPVVVDHANVTHQTMGVHMIPTSIIVDGHGVVRAKISGQMTLEQMHQLIAAASRS